MSKILYVEDNDDNVFMMTSRLRRLGHEVIVAPDGERGIALARSAVPDLILMDLTLPVIDGWEATKQLKAAPDTVGIPIIVLSAHVMPGTREKVAACGADGYVPKPVRMPELTAAIDRLLSAPPAEADG